MNKTQTANRSESTAVTETAAMETFLSSIGAKDRLSIERHLAACDAEPSPTHGRLWRQIAMALFKLAPLPVQTGAQHSVLFFIPDGKYRMQVFALEDPRQGELLVYLPDILDESLKEGLLTGAKPGAAAAEDEDPSEVVLRTYGVAGKKGETLQVELLTATNTPQPAPHFKNMLGWNRKSLRVRVPTAAAAAQAAAVKSLCTLASRHWANKTAPSK